MPKPERPSSNHQRTRCWLCCLAALVGLSSLAVADEFRAQVAPVLKQFCYACHGPDEQQAQIRYDRIGGFQLADRHLWTAVYEKLVAGEMPPEDHPQPVWRLP